MALKFIKVTPTQKNSIDWLGMILMALGVGCLQIFLDRGNNVGWFQANSMVFLAITSFISLGYFITRGIKKSNNIINLKIFLDRNFSFCTLMLGIFGIGVLGIICIQPMLLQNYFGYSAETAGLVLAPKGIAAAVGMVLVATTINRFDPRKLMLIGLLIAIYGTYIMSNYNLQTSEFYWIWSGAIQGLGMGIFMIPLAVLSLSTLSKELIAAGSGLFSFSRNLGMSIGISLLSTLITRESQTNWNQLGSHIDLLNPNLGLWLRQSGMQLTNPLALGELQHQLVFQSGMIAYVDSFRIVAICLLILIPGIFLLKKPDMGKGIEMPH